MSASIYALLVGVAMGFFIQRVRASSPAMIASNLRLENLSVIKFMALTIAVGMVVVYALSLLMPQAMHFDIKPTYVIGVLLGGLVFGVGFGVGGYCPGTCVVGAGEGRKDAFFAILGGVVGALAFTLVYTTLIAPIVPLASYGKITLADVVHLPTMVVALVVGVIFLVVIRALPTEVKKAK
ncbi:MAG: YeeE/YedE thiosulfate transporter family protein [Gemmatimonadota bacterium]|nr:YeeE/YedE thiosulfate transporter family protein [Gemmatimonadota bacterium]